MSATITVSASGLSDAELWMWNCTQLKALASLTPTQALHFVWWSKSSQHQWYVLPHWVNVLNRFINCDMSPFSFSRHLYSTASRLSQATSSLTISANKFTTIDSYLSSDRAPYSWVYTITAQKIVIIRWKYANTNLYLCMLSHTILIYPSFILIDSSNWWWSVLLDLQYSVLISVYKCIATKLFWSWEDYFLLRCNLIVYYGYFL